MKTKVNKTDSDELNYPIITTSDSTILIETKDLIASDYIMNYPLEFNTRVTLNNDTIDSLFENEHFVKKLKQFMFKEKLEKL